MCDCNFIGSFICYGWQQNLYSLFWLERTVFLSLKIWNWYIILAVQCEWWSESSLWIVYILIHFINAGALCWGWWSYYQKSSSVLIQPLALNSLEVMQLHLLPLWSTDLRWVRIFPLTVAQVQNWRDMGLVNSVRH